MKTKLREMFCRKHIAMMAVGIALGAAFFLLGYYLKLPVWLDTSGTILVAISCGLVPAFIVAIVGGSFMSIFLGAQSLLFILVQFALATVFWFFTRKNKSNSVLQISGIMMFGVVIKAVTCTIINLILQMSVPTNPYEIIVFNGFLINDLGMNFSIFWCFLFSNLLVSLIDCVCILIIVVLAYKFIYMPIAKRLGAESMKTVELNASVEDNDKV